MTDKTIFHKLSLKPYTVAAINILWKQISLVSLSSNIIGDDEGEIPHIYFMKLL